MGAQETGLACSVLALGKAGGTAQANIARPPAFMRPHGMRGQHLNTSSTDYALESTNMQQDNMRHGPHSSPVSPCTWLLGEPLPGHVQVPQSLTK